MASFSWRHPFRSIGDIVKDIVIGPEQPRQAPEPIPEPPREPPPREEEFGIDYPKWTTADNYEYDDRRKEIWTEISGEGPNTAASTTAWEIFEDTGLPTGLGYWETNQAFEDFLRAFWLDTNDNGHILRADFYDDWDMVPDLIDWPEWREWRDTPK